MIAGGFPMRFFNRLGASEVEPDSICNAAGHKALEYVYGSSSTGFDPRSIKDAACALLWGINPSASAPHAHKHWFKEAKAFRIVVDPVRHGTAEAADLHLQVRPGTDSALAFAMLHVMKRDGLIDRKFLAGNSIGWDEVEALLPPCTPQWGEAQTGVPAADIERAARSVCEGPVAAVAGPRPAAAAAGRQHLPRGVAAQRRQRQYRQARRRVLLPQRQR